MDEKIFTLTPKYELKTIGNLIKGLPALQKRDIKARELAKISLPQKFTHNNYDIEIVKPPYTVPAPAGLKLVVHVKASQNGQDLNVGDGIFEYINPPILVHDGTYHKALNPMGIEVDARNLVENPMLALKEIIAETVRILNKGEN